MHGWDGTGITDGMAQGWIDGIEHGCTYRVAQGFTTGWPWKRHLEVDLSHGNHSWQHHSGTLLLPAAHGIPQLGHRAGFLLLTDTLQAPPSLQGISQNSWGCPWMILVGPFQCPTETPQTPTLTMALPAPGRRGIHGLFGIHAGFARAIPVAWLSMHKWPSMHPDAIWGANYREHARNRGNYSRKLAV